MLAYVLNHARNMVNYDKIEQFAKTC